ncbi:MAG: hypothetical protein IJC93_07580 [Clostridia bacterium]|nr:hypothetical protein [Clostridia bacterium]
MRKRVLLWAVVVLLLGSLFACATVPPVETTTAATTAPVQSGSPATTVPNDDHLAEEQTVFSATLFCDDEIAIWATPRDNALICLDLASGEQTILCDRAVYPEFFVVGDRVIFRELESGRICAVNTNGGNFISYYQMPLSKGVIKNGVLYFIDDEDNYAAEAVLYKYEPLAGVWSTGILPGCHLSPVYERVAFGETMMYYIAADDLGERVVRQSLATGERSVIYQVDSSRSGCLLSLTWSDGVLYFRDAAVESFFAYSEEDDAVRAIDVPGERICAIMDNGMVTQTVAAESSSLVFSNPAGQYASFRGGEIEAAGLSRALVRRTIAEGKDQLSLVKYPEDEEQGTLSGEILRVISDRAGHAVVFFYGSAVCHFVDLNKGTIREFSSETKYLNRVSLSRYVAMESIDHTVLSGHDLVEAGPDLIAAAFAKALAAGDRFSLAVLLYDYGQMDAFPPVRFAAWEMLPAASTAPDEKFVCRLRYTPYTEGDLSILDFAPEVLRDGRLTLTCDGVCWIIVPSEARNTRSR